MGGMSLKAKIIALVVALLVAGLGLVKLDIWYTARQAETSEPAQIEQEQP